MVGAMPTRTEIVMIKDKPWDRAVRVTVTAPSLEGVNFEELAQRAWRTPAREAIIGDAEVKVEPFGR